MSYMVLTCYWSQRLIQWQSIWFIFLCRITDSGFASNKWIYNKHWICMWLLILCCGYYYYVVAFDTMLWLFILCCGCQYYVVAVNTMLWLLILCCDCWYYVAAVDTMLCLLILFYIAILIILTNKVTFIVYAQKQNIWKTIFKSRWVQDKDLNRIAKSVDIKFSGHDALLSCMPYHRKLLKCSSKNIILSSSQIIILVFVN